MTIIIPPSEPDLSSRAKRTAALVLLLGMFVWSGASKVAKLGATQTKPFVAAFEYAGIGSKAALTAAAAIVFLAGVWELVAVGAIAYGEYAQRKSVVRRGVEGLMVFTVLATLIFKVYPKLKPIQIAANASVLGGLALYHICSQ